MAALDLASRAMSSTTMVEKFLRSRNITNERVLAAMGKVPRHIFVPGAFREQAYADRPLPIGDDQTISQPYIVAYMSQTLDVRPEHRVLEIGTGSGYQSAILAQLAKSVFTVERIHRLANEARKRLDTLCIDNVSSRCSNGAYGWEEFAPYDRIISTAACEKVPEAWLKQLKPEGIIVTPIEDGQGEQNLICMAQKGRIFTTSVVGKCSFVPFIV